MALSIGTISLLLDSALDSGAYTHVVGIDCGGSGAIGADGVTYLADRHYSGGYTASTSSAIANTVDDFLYRTERWGECVYTIPLAMGVYRVRVLLAEIYDQITATGQRVFTIKFQPGTLDEVSVSSIDQFALAGFAAATEIVRDIVVGSNGQLVIQTIAQTQQPALKGIVVQSNAGGVYNPSSPTLPSIPSAPATESSVLRTTQFVIPPEFVGIHCYTVPYDVRGYHAWGTATPPTFAYGIRRSINYDGCFWYDIHKGSSSSNWVWDDLDDLVDHTYSKGAQFMYSMLYTPAHLASLPSFPSPAPNWLGSTSMPNNLTEVAAFITALVTRYNTGGVRKLHAIEVWNEPAINGEDYLASVNVKPYWIGSVSGNDGTKQEQRLNDLALLHKTIAVAAKAADPGIKIVGPGWSPGGSAEVSSYWTGYYNRTISTGGTPLQYTDIFACHPYTGGGTTGSGSASASLIWVTMNAYNTCRNAVDSSKPLWGTECGNEGTSVTYAQQATVIKRKALLAAAAGMASVHWYAYEDDQYLGTPYTETATSNALAALTTSMVGKTMTRCSILVDGTVWSAYSDGTEFRE